MTQSCFWREPAIFFGGNSLAGTATGSRPLYSLVNTTKNGYLPCSPQLRLQRTFLSPRISGLGRAHFGNSLACWMDGWGISAFRRRSRVDEVMRGMQGTHDKAPLARFCPLPLWVGVGVVGAIQMESRSQADKTQRFHEMKGNCYMARVINFYIPENFRRKATTVPQSKPGKLIRFYPAKKSA